jgi:ubiquinone/menaquinone biosynthesis C-methylase UbiE
MSVKTDAVFSGSLPKAYDTYLVPIFFESYAKDLASRLQKKQVLEILEIAAGTGVVTRFMDTMLPENVNIVATDLNQTMLDQAVQLELKRKVKWMQADAMQLPFADASFNAVVCQFGVMFFPDRVKAYSEVFRVLKPGGIFLFNVWDRLEENDFFNVVNDAMKTVFQKDPPQFLSRTPYGYFDEAQIAKDLTQAGFKKTATMETINFPTTAGTPSVVAMSICSGTPLKNEIENRDASLLDKATRTAEEFLAKRFGPGPVEGKMQAKVIEVEK